MMPGIVLPKREDECDAYREWRVREDEREDDKLLAEFAELMRMIAAARFEC